MHLLRRPRGLLFVTLAEPLLYPFRGIGGWRKDPYAKNVPLGGATARSGALTPQ